METNDCLGRLEEQTIDNGLTSVLDAMSQGVLLLDKNLVVRGHNLAFRRLMEIEGMDRFIGQPYREVLQFLLERDEFVHTENQEHFVAERLRSLQSREPHHLERVRPNGTILSVSAMPLPSGDYVYTFLDVTREKRAQEEMRRNAKAAVLAMANLAEHRDTDTGAHVMRVARLVMQTARKLKSQGHFPDLIDDAYVEHVGTASVLHDVGKMATPDQILFKNGPLTDDERATINLHPAVGAKLIKQAHFVMGHSLYLKIGVDIAQAHHEWYDGSGYPDGLAGDEIPLAGRICAIADVFDALTSRRPYKAPWSTAKAIELIRKQSGTQFDPVIAAAFIAAVEEREAVRLIQWSESMSVNHLHIDEQHQILIDIINHLASAGSQNDRPLVSMIIDELMSYAAYHFYFEEQIMEAAQFPDLIEHQKTHQDFVNWVTEARKEFLIYRDNQLSLRILNFLSDWLRDHILDADMRYRSFIGNQADGPRSSHTG